MSNTTGTIYIREHNGFWNFFLTHDVELLFAGVSVLKTVGLLKYWSKDFGVGENKNENLRAPQQTLFSGKMG